MNNQTFITKLLMSTGVAIIIAGSVGSLILGDVYKISHSSLFHSYEKYNFTLAISGIIGSIILGLFFIALAEITHLLKQNADNQEKIIKALKENSTIINRHKTQSENKLNSSDIQCRPNHLFRCENCGKMIAEYPCHNCGFKFN